MPPAKRPATPKSAIAPAPPAPALAFGPLVEATLDTMAGHQEARIYLRRAMEQGRLPHAMLFHGPRSVGKRTCAVALAKVLGCRPGASAADQADVARRISLGLFPDLLIVGPSGPTNSITLAGWRPDRDEGDALQYYRFLDCGPMEGGRKMLIIRDADRMNIALANYLLKLIEEPPSYLTIVLTALRRMDVLTTIRSRCAPLKFSPLTTVEMAATADAWLGADRSATRATLLQKALGRPGVLRQAATQDDAARQAQVAEAMARFLRLGFISIFGVASALLPGKAGSFPTAGMLEGTHNDLLAWFRDAVLVKSLGPEGARPRLANSTHAAAVEEFSRACSPDGLDRALRILEDFRPLSLRPMDPSFLLEHLLLRLGPVLRS